MLGCIPAGVQWSGDAFGQAELRADHYAEWCVTWVQLDCFILLEHPFCNAVYNKDTQVPRNKASTKLQQLTSAGEWRHCIIVFG